MSGIFGKRRIDKGFDEFKENVTIGQALSKTGFFTHDLITDKLVLTEQVFKLLDIGSSRNFYSILHKEGQKAVMDHESFETCLITEKGSKKYLQVWTKTIFDEDDKPVKIFGALQDITDRKLIEDNLKALGDDLNIAQKVSGVGSWRYDILKDEFHGSEEMYSIYGIKPEEFDNDFESTISLIHPDDRDKVRHCLDEHLAGRSCEVEFRIPQKDGSIKYVKGKAKAISDETGQVVSIIGTLRDITQEKLLQMELEKHLKMMEMGQKLTKAGSWVFDLKTNRNYGSNGVYRIFGVEPEKFDDTYESFLQMVHEEDRKRVDETFASRPEGPFEMEFRVVRSDGTVCIVHQVAEYVFDDENNPEYLYGVFRDITEEKKLHDEIEKKQRDRKDEKQVPRASFGVERCV